MAVLLGQMEQRLDRFGQIDHRGGLAGLRSLMAVGIGGLGLSRVASFGLVSRSFGRARLAEVVGFA